MDEKKYLSGELECPKSARFLLVDKERGFAFLDILGQLSRHLHLKFDSNLAHARMRIAMLYEGPELTALRLKAYGYARQYLIVEGRRRALLEYHEQRNTGTTSSSMSE